MTLRLADVRLLVRDFDACLAFYGEVLGLTVRLQVKGVYAELEAGGAVVSIYRRDLMQDRVPNLQPPGDQVVLAFDVEDLDGRFAQLEQGGATVVTPPHTDETWEIRVARFRDPDGNLFELNERPSHA
jgi:catechol 2,3-dioxygenase-like lactoylglutathione lyase family enzyme